MCSIQYIYVQRWNCYSKSVCTKLEHFQSFQQSPFDKVLNFIGMVMNRKRNKICCQCNGSRKTGHSVKFMNLKPAIYTLHLATDPTIRNNVGGKMVPGALRRPLTPYLIFDKTSKYKIRNSKKCIIQDDLPYFFNDIIVSC